MLLGSHCSIQSINSLVYSMIGVASWKPNIAQRHTFLIRVPSVGYALPSFLRAPPFTLHTLLGVHIVQALLQVVGQAVDNEPPDVVTLSWPLKSFAFAIESIERAPQLLCGLWSGSRSGSLQKGTSLQLGEVVEK